MPRSATPFMMFVGQAEEALRLYVQAFPDATVEGLDTSAEPGSGGKDARYTFRLAGQSFMVFDSSMKHEFGFTPSFSIFVECESLEELERSAALLSEGGAVMMPLGDYGFSQRFTWLSDRFGVSWQLNLA